MLLFDIGAILFIAGVLNFLYFFISPKHRKADKNARLGLLSLLFLLYVTGAILMMISHYVVEGVQSYI